MCELIGAGDALAGHDPGLELMAFCLRRCWRCQLPQGMPAIGAGSGASVATGLPVRTSPLRPQRMTVRDHSARSGFFHWHSQGIPTPHWQPSSSVHARWGLFSHTQPMPRQTFAGRVDHETSLTGWCRYASIAQFERTSLRRSPDLSIPMISSSKKFADQFGSLSSPDFSSTLQAIAKDYSTRSVSVIAEKTEPRPIRSSTSSGRRLEACWSATRSAKEKAWGPPLQRSRACPTPSVTPPIPYGQRRLNFRPYRW